MEEILIVDGYNIIGSWPRLRELKEKGNLEGARDELLDWLSEYQAFKGRKVIVVFDAHQVSGQGKKYKDRRLTVHFTKENETADEFIEKLVGDLNHRKRMVYVATSDYTEQRVIFGRGALRISARELFNEQEMVKDNILETVKHKNQSLKQNLFSVIDSETIKFFENLRRKK
ncbi:NYN domain-containing protein [Tepidibacillus marianensis]|uniref:NYN domain-containing protein n=1 Tax=Tepidibacillus marianensis TaxID=3131995 RepID=UPI0030CD618C